MQPRLKLEATGHLRSREGSLRSISAFSWVDQPKSENEDKQRIGRLFSSSVSITFGSGIISDTRCGVHQSCETSTASVHTGNMGDTRMGAGTGRGQDDKIQQS